MLFLHNLSGRRILLDAGDAVLAGFQFLVAFAGSDDLGVCSLQSESELALRVFVYFELRVLLSFEAFLLASANFPRNSVSFGLVSVALAVSRTTRSTPWAR